MRELAKLTPEQREKVWKAVIAVMNLPEDQQAKLIFSEDERRKKAREEIDQKRKELGIPDEREKKWPFIRTYFGERRKMEEEIREKSEALRVELTAKMDQRLREKFGPDAQQSVQQVAPREELKEEPEKK